MLQQAYIYQPVATIWENEIAVLQHDICRKQEHIAVGGDEWCDSMSYSAKYGNCTFWN